MDGEGGVSKVTVSPTARWGGKVSYVDRSVDGFNTDKQTRHNYTEYYDIILARAAGRQRFQLRRLPASKVDICPPAS